MKHILISLALCLCAFADVSAQSTMTEQQVIQYIMTQHEAGKSNQDIVAELLKKGVTPEQLKRIKDKYEHQSRTGALDLTGTRNAGQEAASRMRGKQGVRQVRAPQGAENALSPRQRREYDDELSQEMESELGALLVSGNMEADKSREGAVRRVFGRDIFNNEMLSFEPDENVATPGNYRLGAGDAVFIDVWGATQMAVSSTISPDGTVTIEGLGPVNLAGMTVDKANAYLKRQMETVYAGSNVRVTVGQTRTISVNVMGEVVTPGTYTISAFATAFHALYAAGGVNDIGTLRSIFVYRDGKKAADIDVYDYILHGKTRGDIRLQTGDVIYVGPYYSLVDIEGKVKRPMYYEMKQGESLATLLGFAGSFSGDAYKQTVRVVRKSGYDYTVHTVEEFDFSAFRMMDGDSVTVDSIISRYSNMVEVRGAVYRPGMYQMDGKTKTVRELLTAIDGPTEEALKGRAVIYRMKDDRSREVKSFNLEALLNGTAADIPLRNEDIIQIFDQEKTRTGRTLTIYGSVNYPGVYQYAEGCSIEDLILQAGGLTDDASLSNIEVSRHEIDRLSTKQSDAVTRTFTFNLTPGLVASGYEDFVLQPYDEVYVRRSPSWTDSRTISVRGEVNFEGTFALQRKDERLSDIIRRAGGLTDYAYVAGAHLERTMSNEEMERKKALLRLSRTSTDSIDNATLDISNVYTVGIDLRSALEHPGGIDDIILSNGDVLVIPEQQNLVKVNGAVMYPNAVAWQKGKSAKYYVELAGGYSSRAKKSKAFVVGLNGTVQRAKKVKDILPGSEIVVPTKPERRRMSTGELVAVGTGTASLATMIATIVSLFVK